MNVNLFHFHHNITFVDNTVNPHGLSWWSLAALSLVSVMFFVWLWVWKDTS